MAEACIKCHGDNAARQWQGSFHAEFDVSCASCYKLHSPWTNEKALIRQETNDTCLSCHQSMRKTLYQRSSHPLRDGQMTCVDCHSPHGSAAEASVAAITANEKCYECHADKRGPCLFEHAPVREDCMTCHDPHGSNQTMLLKTALPGFASSATSSNTIRRFPVRRARCGIRIVPASTVTHGSTEATILPAVGRGGRDRARATTTRIDPAHSTERP